MGSRAKETQRADGEGVGGPGRICGSTRRTALRASAAVASVLVCPARPAVISLGRPRGPCSRRVNPWPPSERPLCRLAVSAGQVWGSGGAWTALAGGTAIRWACPRFLPPAPGGHAGRSVREYFKSRFQLLSFSIVFF